MGMHRGWLREFPPLDIITFTYNLNELIINIPTSQLPDRFIRNRGSIGGLPGVCIKNTYF